MTITGTYEGTQNEMKPYTLQSKKVKKKNLSYVKDTALCEKKQTKNNVVGKLQRTLGNNRKQSINRCT